MKAPATKDRQLVRARLAHFAEWLIALEESFDGGNDINYRVKTKWSKEIITLGPHSQSRNGKNDFLAFAKKQIMWI